MEAEDRSAAAAAAAADWNWTVRLTLKRIERRQGERAEMLAWIGRRRAGDREGDGQQGNPENEYYDRNVEFRRWSRQKTTWRRRSKNGATRVAQFRQSRH